MSTVPKLSIGLPVYNGEKYVVESLEATRGRPGNAGQENPPSVDHPDIQIDAIMAGRHGRPS